MESFHAITILSVRKHGKVVLGGNGQVALGNTVVKANAGKTRLSTPAHHARLSDTSR